MKFQVCLLVKMYSTWIQFKYMILVIYHTNNLIVTFFLGVFMCGLNDLAVLKVAIQISVLEIPCFWAHYLCSFPTNMYKLGVFLLCC